VAVSYAEGDWFAVPLRDGQGYAVGRVVRVAPKGRIIVAYFFDQVWTSIPNVDDVTRFSPEAAILKAECGDLGLVNGTWPVLGSTGTFDRVNWPMPAFAKKPALGNDYLRVVYPGDRPGTKPRESRISEDEARSLPAYGMAGAGYIELKLGLLLEASAE
jgi:hypothetical protein